MKISFTKSLFLAVYFIIPILHQAQCAADVAGGSASNMFTQIRNSTNPVAADKALNTVVFIHRNDAGFFGGNSGNLRYDVSVNGGSTWTNNQGVLNPVNSNLARYPNLAIYNPSNNINPANAYVSYMAATINSATSAWNGLVTGVRQLNGLGNTETYNQPVLASQLIPHSIVKGAPGIFWAIDPLYVASITGFAIYKGVWNSALNDIVWSTNYSVTPAFATAGLVGDYNIAFDPTGNIGWFSFLSRLTPGPSNSSYFPVLYKTTDGGATWTGPIQVDLSVFSCINSNMVSPNVPTTNFEHDLVVDVNGNPHVLTTICNGNNGYSVLYANWHHMFDITQINGVWAAYDIANVNAGRGTYGVAPNQATQDMTPQAARTADGTKLFFTWTDNTTYTLGAANQTPELFGKAFDVVQNKWTPIKDFTSCNFATAGKIYFPHLAPEVLEPSLNTYKLASVYGEFSSPANDPLLTSNFKFLDNVTFAASEFSVNNPTAPLSITQGNNLLLCPSGNQAISIPGGNYSQILWNTGAVTNAIAVTQSTNNFYFVTVQSNCLIGIDTIFVTNMSINASAINTSICPGSSTTLSVIGNANNYTWLPGSLTGSLASVSPSASTIYTLLAGGGNNCVATQTLPITVYPAPTISIAGQDSLCIGSVLSLTASGASTYSWSNGDLGPYSSSSPQANTTYTVFGVDVNICENTQTIAIVVVPLPTVSATSSRSVICKGQNVTITASGANTYSWSNNNSSSVSIVVSPTSTTVYTLTGYNSFGCSKTALFTQTVNACIGISEMSSETMDFSIFPNPNNGDFTILCRENTELSLFNELGQLIHFTNLNETNDRELSLRGLPNGIYFVVGRTSQFTETKKIIVAD